MSVDLKNLIGKLNEPTRKTLESAVGLCVSRTHYDVEIEHYLMKLLDAADNDMAAILRAFGVDKGKLAAELTRALDRLKTGNARTPSLAPSLVRLMTQAWTIGTLNYNAGQVRTGFSILALLSEEDSARIAREIGKELQKIELVTLKKDFLSIVKLSAEGSMTAAGLMGQPLPGQAAGEDGAPVPSAGTKTPHLDQYTVNLTENARKGKIDPVLARDFEIRQVIDILTRRRQNNPILVGEAGVGKTAVVEGFAARIVAGDVPPPLRNVEVHVLDLALLQAGAGVKGEFENRLKGLINEVKSASKPVILFIDEAHTMIGAGGSAGQGDAANILKPALARGELRTLAATTWAEYKKFFEKDAALSRRFQLVKVEEPSETACQLMLRGVVSALENHHGVRILDEGLAAAVRLSHRYLPDRQLPDKAVSVLDTACSRLSLSQSAMPGPIEDAQRSLDDLAVQERILTREANTGVNHSERLLAIAQQREGIQAKLDGLNTRWEQEKVLVGQIRELRARLEDPAAATAQAGDGQATATQPAMDPAAMRAELAALNAELTALQGQEPLMRVTVDASIVGEVISGWTGIPVGKMLSDEVQVVLELEKHLQRRVIGQDHAMHVIAQRIRTAKAGMDDPGKPVGVFLLVGPSGVGKTETALTVSDMLYGGERNVITINMSEFQEAHTVSTLKGSPPGYVGYGEGGVLTEAVRRRPYSVVLLDEIEKAHPDVLELFFQVFDKGQMEDGEGRQIDFKNTIIILTSNAGTDTLMKLVADPETAPSPQGLVAALKPELDKAFKPAFLGRTVIVPYYPVRDEALKQIIRLKLGKIQRRLNETHKIALTYDEAMVETVAGRCTEVESGARNVDNILTNTLLPDVSTQLLGAMADGQRPDRIHVTVGAEGQFVYA